MYICSRGNEGLDEQIQTVQFNYPYNAVVGEDATMIYIPGGREGCGCEATAVLQATKLLLAAFYVFHIAYQELSYFCEHYLFGINSQKTLPTSVIQLCNALVNMYLSTEKH